MRGFRNREPHRLKLVVSLTAAMQRKIGIATIFVPLVAIFGLTGAVFAASQIEVSGVSEPIHDLTLSFPVAGRLGRVLVVEGQNVVAGERLMELDHALERLEVKRRRLLLRDVARLDEAQQRESILKKQWQQARQLFQRQSVSRKQLEDEQLVYEAAHAERRVLQGEKQREQVELELAEAALQQRLLFAPIDAQIAAVFFQSGESVSAHQPVMQLVDVRRARFVGNMLAADGALVQPGNQVKLRFADLPLIDARVVFVSPVADKTSGLVEIHAEFDNRTRTIKPGIAGHLLIDVDSVEQSSNP